MTDASTTGQPHRAMWLIWLALFVGLPALVAAWEARAPLSQSRPTAARLQRPATPPPAVAPVRLYALDRDQARSFNAAIPFSRLPNPAARPFLFSGSPTDLARAIDCLAAAQIYEAGDDAVGERAVAQVVLNRVRHPAFPKTVCGVVFQGQERATGCQFTFTCDGALARTPTQAAWERARDIAKSALAGKVYKPVGYATHYHTDWVVPYWSGSLDKIGAVGAHLFFRWRGWWGTPPAFRRAGDNGEPLVQRIARLSAAHQGGPDAPGALSPLVLAGGAAADLAARPQQMIGTESLGQMMAGVRLIAIAPGAKSFLVELGRTAVPDSWPTLAQTFCAGRPECRIMAWRAGTAPGGLPLSGDQMESMAFAYIHNSATGLQRSLWNCLQTQRANKDECMRQRIPTAPAPELAGVRRKERFEVVKIAPPPPVVAAPAKP
ncbi:cell wall hydrolase [Sphingobium chlorophenolicum]|uniref:Cell wall hydrolase SleB n=1 Tax=Sphingobium chlorophenolicum TaxID=46429 RepID=A0A081RC16_SPHCR|nr:cell wall hydrolase [Sphingobium chlorophenolicum]KEQ52739.1 Cell wall hydrolase SleB [Sphingobium chlorophenolicum]